jgi:hypothetical protein
MIAFINKYKNILFVIIIAIIAYFVYDYFTNDYHSKDELNKLKIEIAVKEQQYKDVIRQKEILQDSSNYFENIALQYDNKVDQIKHKIVVLTQEKNNAVSSLHNQSKPIIDSFFVKRYSHITKNGVNIVLDKNVGNEVIKEITEKDFMHKEIGLLNDNTKLLTNQVDTLKISLSYSKQALIKADTALKIRSQQLASSQELNRKLEKDVKTAKRKAYLGTIRGTLAGFALGVATGIIVK